MSYLTYKLMHFLGIFAMLTALAATAMHAARGGTRADNPYRAALGATHGLAAILILTGGFGMLARLGVMQGGLPTWAFVKLGIWVLLAAAMALPYRSRGMARSLLVVVPLLAGAAAATALYKPF
jgi:hypothetical protein